MRRRPDRDVTNTDDAATLESAEVQGAADAPRWLVLTVLAHADPRRIGEIAVLALRGGAQTLSLSRSEPPFTSPRSDLTPRALEDRRVSRQPIEIRITDRGLEIEREQATASLTVDGHEVGSTFSAPSTDLDAGVVLLLARALALCIRVETGARPSSADQGLPGLIGESSQIRRVRREVRSVATEDLPVLILGETGTGKELVARAIHERSRRSKGAFVAVNIAAIPAELAAAELFGAAEGAFTGARQARRGLFQQAHLGTLFLDEIGAANDRVQAALLRALEAGVVTPVGSTQEQTVDVRVLAATDAALRTERNSGSFRSALLHRLSGYRISMPSLRDRREDIGRLARHFLDEGAAGSSPLPEAQRSQVLYPPLVAQMAAAPWPGNVRQLRNLVQSLAVANQESPALSVPAWVSEELVAPEEAQRSDRTEAGPTDPRRRQVRDVSDAELVAVLERHRYRVRSAARELGIARSSLYDWISRHRRLRRASDVTLEDLEQARTAAPGASTSDLAAALGVSPEGLALRLVDLGLAPRDDS